MYAIRQAILALPLLACGPSGANIPVLSPPPQDSADPYLDAEPPVAAMEAPSAVRVGEEANFDGSASYDPQGYPIRSWEWTCEDGTSAEGEVVQVVFHSIADLSCTLRVTSESGLSDEVSADLRVVSSEAAQWTFMVHMAGDNDLEEAALEDMNEMERVGSSAEVNIVVQIDRSAHYVTGDGDWSGGRRYLVEQDEEARSISSTVLADLGQIDSGDPQTVIDFATWAIDEFPAIHYGLVFWDHGWGWSLAAGGTKGLSSDYQANSEISVARGELEQVLETVSAHAGTQLALMGMDACSMGSWEVAYVAADSAQVFVASQASESMDGWPYDTAMADLIADPQLDGAGLGDRIALRFQETGDETQSVLDLSRMDELSDALDHLAQAALDSGEPADLLAAGARDAQEFEGGWGVDHDLGDFLAELGAAQISSEVRLAVEQAQQAYQQTVVASYTNGRHVAKATGTSIYTPYGTGLDAEYELGRWAEERLWDDFLSAALEGW